ncbi:phytanoyl-CoA dioxygenase family protein [Halostagnicola sp. A-GB9-2]|uniref:phytanoyl-CoA dioxygenase family protein n=1 Tax=Halostagnicola sp. A-GB9-2 TaxID=3048066 RepID=UPI0024C09764|nr:phytanoyl-CoA dioxygenase family protein [Halostagnicola sp. A-GB9-2]MDJ1431536.1 phytanoyl-CoA dioxygenase family protein [Halostagnicola sp. A-GB9-2]
MKLTDEQFEQYQAEGYVVVEDVLADETIDRVRERLREYTHGDREPETFGKQLEPAVERGEVDVDEPGDAVRKMEGLGMVEEDEVFEEVARDETIVSINEHLLGEHLKLLRSAAMLKPPHVGSEKSFHQDAAYYPIRPMDHVTVWIAVDEATLENGCMSVVPGEHTEGIITHETDEYETDIVIGGEEYDDEDLVKLPMEPGDALFQHCLLPHYTEPNTTDSPRRALIMSYMDARSRFTQNDEERPDWVDSVHIQGEEFPGCV